MRRLSLLLFMFVLVACARAAPSVPESPAPQIATETTVALANPTATAAAPRASTNTPTLTRTATRTPTIAPPAPPTPSGVMFKFDDGVPQAQRETLITGIAAARAYLGESRPMTIISFADLNAQMDELSRIQNLPRTSLTRQLQLLQADRAFGGPTLLAFPMSKNWQARAQENRLQTAVHEYFHAVEGYLTNTDPFNYSVAEWL